MEKVTKKTFDKSVYNPYVFATFKTIKKFLTYSFYIAILYFAYEGFMAWK